MSFVLDVSVVAGLFFEDEEIPYSLVEHFAAGETAIVPDLFTLEVLNLFLTAVRRNRATVEDLPLHLEHLSQLPIETRWHLDEPGDIMPLALRYSLTAYDACYLELAIVTSSPLATSDLALAKAAIAAGVPLALS